MVEHKLSFGLELEWADVDKRTPIPEKYGKWDWRDWTMVNSDGTANDPTGKTNWKGGEINTAPTDSVAEQVKIVSDLAKLLSPTINYRCNLHVHVGISNAITDLDMLKRLAKYIRANETFVWNYVEPIPKPTRDKYESDDAFKGAMKRYKRRLVSHHYSISQERYEEMIDATDPQHFYESHAPKGRKGQRVWHIVPRAGMNLRSLFKHGTIEFRHFPGTADPKEIESALSWCEAFTDAAINNGKSAEEIYKSREWTFPKFRKYQHTLELGYQKTKFDGKLET